MPTFLNKLITSFIIIYRSDSNPTPLHLNYYQNQINETAIPGAIAEPNWIKQLTRTALITNYS